MAYMECLGKKLIWCIDVYPHLPPTGLQHGGLGRALSQVCSLVTVGGAGIVVMLLCKAPLRESSFFDFILVPGQQNH